MSNSQTGKVEPGDKPPKLKPPSFNTKTEEEKKTDGGWTITGATEGTRNSGGTKTTETKNSGGKTEGTKADDEKKTGTGGSGGKTKTEQGSGGKGSGGKNSLTGKGSDGLEEKTGREPAAAAAAAAKRPPTPTSAQRTQSEVKTAKCTSITTAKDSPGAPGAQSKGRKSAPLVVAKPSDPRVHVKSAGSASSTTKASSGSRPRDGTKTKTPVKSIDSAEKSCMAPSPVGAPPSWHFGWPIAALLTAILLALFLFAVYFVIAKAIKDAADVEEVEKMKSGWELSPPASSPGQRVDRQKRHFGTTSDRVKFRVREPPDPPPR